MIVLVFATSSIVARADDVAPEDKIFSPLPGIDPREVILNRQEMHIWQRYVRGFRRDHNFALSSSIAQNTWKIDQFGTLKGKQFQRQALVTRFQYSFHIPIYKGFGYMLGSSMGYALEQDNPGQPFTPASAFQIPGALVGLVWNYSPGIRFSSSAETYLERHDGIKEADHLGEDAQISITGLSYDIGLYLDLFYELGWALRIEAHNRQLYILPPKYAFGAIDAKMRKDEQSIGMGIVHHLL